VWIHPSFPGKTWDAGVDVKTPPAVNTALLEGRQQLTKIKSAMNALRQNPEAFGGWQQWMLPTMVQGILDPEGQKARNPVSDVGSLEIKDRTGAVMAKAEAQRLGFIPRDGDPPKVAHDKLARLYAWQETEQAAMREQYPAARGFGEAGGESGDGDEDTTKADAWQEYRRSGMSAAEATARVNEEYGE
jgi:hypothetical protein